MAEGALLSDEARQTVLRWESAPITQTVEKGHVWFFANAIDDPNPLWSNELFARKTRFGGLVSPPTYLRTLTSVIPEMPEFAEFDRALDAGSQWEYGEPVRVGDTITAVSRVANLMQRSLNLGPAIFLVLETTYTNQFGELVAKQRSTLIRFREGRRDP